MKNHKLLKREDNVTCDDAAGNGRIVADACSRGTAYIAMKPRQSSMGLGVHL